MTSFVHLGQHTFKVPSNRHRPYAALEQKQTKSAWVMVLLLAVTYSAAGAKRSSETTPKTTKHHLTSHGRIDSTSCRINGG
jgi:hypothetical protein|mmetsp:Transcript_50111/g.83927  ORF Transcript_50111/g.83927 Transcript_50111/m.83927 type:complete len:81 (+) Transcript_50111:1261-1503(+)|eukprot:CAMPEP_0174302986 /NCGR_PEP_ID=MMETSP0809-20121228/59925_1 /TAXON_ID=73025 ORGANISM="Eutreptiella gymnastica-like, Strain CCMP1594" /NCGR_SAMPLE_ID=MMETSP0809 /ASSEMBLY_ACC=CAM_ASM_000658 /LENGTH=80 /DNA_ID=CAMNT_0015408941 /DNA_START=1240 /DNA_END=1482 /DNA_ORIENTATION=-